MRKILLAALDWCRPKDPPVSLGIASIASYLRNKNIDYLLQSWNVNSETFNPSQVVEYAMENSGRDVDFAVGAFVWNESSVQYITRELKKHRFEGNVILGGPQVSYVRKNLEGYYPLADVFVRGYGEIALAKYALGRRNIPGVHFAGEPDLGLSSNVDLEALPSPFLDGLIKPQSFVRWETQRGCPFQCSFCQHREANVSQKRKLFASSRIFQEIEWICANPVVNDIAVLDPTFNTGPQYLNIIRSLSEGGYAGKIAFQCRLEMCTEEFLQAVAELNESANAVLEFGVQTIHRDEQKLIQRPNNLKKAQKVMEMVKGYGIESEISLIFGLPGQTVKSFEESVAWCIDQKPSKVIAFPLMLLRGTPLYDRKMALELQEAAEIAHPAIERIQEDIPHVISSPTFTFEEWKMMADIAASL